jgi:hypothetical protein
MPIKFCFFVLILFIGQIFNPILAQKVKPTEQSNPKLIYEDFITGFKNAWIEIDEKSQKGIDDGERGELLKTIKKYLAELGFESVVITTTEKLNLSKKNTTSCENAIFQLNWEADGFEIVNLSIQVSDCNGAFYKFVKKGVIKIDFSLERTLLTEWRKLLNHKKVIFDSERTPILFKGSVSLNEIAFKKKLDKNGAKDIEGVYELMKEPGSSGLVQKLRIGIEKQNEREYNIYYFSGALHKDDWTEGELKGEMTKTGKKDFYKVLWKRDNKTTDEEVFCSSTEQGILIFKFIEGSATKDYSYLKLYPVF